MGSITLAWPSLRRAVAAVGVASLALVGLPAPAGAGTDGTSVPTIDTYSGWDGVSYLYPFGHSDTSTYGQVVTVPAGLQEFKRFNFYLASNTGTGTLTFRGEVYGWNGTMATEEVWESRPRDLELTAGDPTYHRVRFRRMHASVVPGQQYVVFLSISKDYETTDPGVLSQWATNYTDVLPGGNVVYLNDAGDESQWTTQPWSQIGDYDFAMKAKLT